MNYWFFIRKQFDLFRIDKIFRMDISLFKNCSESPIWHIKDSDYCQNTIVKM